MKEQKKCVPEIRFAGFTDDWEQRKLGEISDKVIDKNIKVIYSETFTNSAEFGVISQRDFFDKDISNSDNLSNYYVVQNNDFIYNPRISNFAPVGPIRRNKLGRTGVMSPLYYVFRVRDVQYEFLDAFFETDKWHSFMKLYGDMGARADRISIKDSIFAGMPLMLPSLEEQTAIGNFFKQLDDTIALHRRNCIKFQNLKVAYLESIFSAKYIQNKDKNKNDWEQRKLGEIYENNTERNTHEIGYDKTISIATMIYKSDGNGASLKSLSNYKVLRMGDIAFEGHTNKQFRYGRFIVNDIGIGIMSPRFATLRPKRKMPISFWKYYIHYEPIMRNVLVNATKAGTMMNELVVSEFLNQTIFVPSLEEQTAIGNFFKQLDDTIALHQKELAKYQQIKAACLEKMFVK